MARCFSLVLRQVLPVTKRRGDGTCRLLGDIAFYFQPGYFLARCPSIGKGRELSSADAEEHDRANASCSNRLPK